MLKLSSFSKSIFVAMGVFLLFLGFNNCGEGFQANHLDLGHGDGLVNLIYNGSRGELRSVKANFKVEDNLIIVGGDQIVGNIDHLIENEGTVALNYAQSESVSDIMFINSYNTSGKRQKMMSSVAKGLVYRLWNNGDVPHMIMDNIMPSDKETLLRHIDSFNKVMSDNNIKVKLIEKSPSDKGFVVFRKNHAESCAATVGYNGSVSTVLLGDDCFTESTIHHEIMHVLGYWHEHSRSDRDKYVTIYSENIAPGHEDNFLKLPGIESVTAEYDYDSIMHYNSVQYSSNGQPTITRKSGAHIHAGKTFSKLDIQGLINVYGTVDMVKDYNPMNLTDKEVVKLIYQGDDSGCGNCGGSRAGGGGAKQEEKSGYDERQEEANRKRREQLRQNAQNNRKSEQEDTRGVVYTIDQSGKVTGYVDRTKGTKVTGDHKDREMLTPAMKKNESLFNDVIDRYLSAGDLDGLIKLNNNLGRILSSPAELAKLSPATISKYQMAHQKYNAVIAQNKGGTVVVPTSADGFAEAEKLFDEVIELSNLVDKTLIEAGAPTKNVDGDYIEVVPNSSDPTLNKMIEELNARNSKVGGQINDLLNSDKPADYKKAKELSIEYKKELNRRKAEIDNHVKETERIKNFVDEQVEKLEKENELKTAEQSFDKVISVTNAIDKDLVAAGAPTKNIEGGYKEVVPNTSDPTLNKMIENLNARNDKVGGQINDLLNSDKPADHKKAKELSQSYEKELNRVRNEIQSQISKRSKMTDTEKKEEDYKQKRLDEHFEQKRKLSEQGIKTRGLSKANDQESFDPNKVEIVEVLASTGANAKKVIDDDTLSKFNESEKSKAPDRTAMGTVGGGLTPSKESKPPSVHNPFGDDNDKRADAHPVQVSVPNLPKSCNGIAKGKKFKVDGKVKTVDRVEKSDKEWPYVRFTDNSGKSCKK